MAATEPSTTDPMSIEQFDITVGPFTFQARRAGPRDGRPVILLHGVPQTSACWIAQLEVLAAAGHHGVAFTQRGYSPGARVDDVAAFTLDKLAGDVLGVADALGFDTFDVVGHDAGAGVAWTLGGYHANRVETLTIASVPHPAAFANAYRSSKGGSDGGDGGQHERSGYMRQIVSSPRGQMEQLFLAGDGQVMRAMFAGVPSSSVDEYIEVLGTPEGMRGVLDWYRAGALREPGVPRGMDPDFPAIEVPTLFVWSDEDPAIGPAGAYATEQHVRGPYRFVVLEGIGHWIPETAAERFSDELLAHLAAHPRRG
ncbi:MAG TPA: alpha/beta hydrolase [Microthrixaceae bacterium]|nr:alpha/beta hydrolase [Microthrixaceae bacterium]